MSDAAEFDRLLEQLERWKATPSEELDRPLGLQELKTLLPRAGQQERFGRAVADQYGEVFPLLGTLCTLYLQAGPDTRARARAVVRRNSDLMLALDHWRPETGSGRTAEEYRLADPERWLRLYLARISLADGGPDWRDQILDVEYVRTQLAREGIDGRAIFEELAAISDETARDVIRRGL
jgi:hypothetical protein